MNKGVCPRTVSTTYKVNLLKYNNIPGCKFQYFVKCIQKVLFTFLSIHPFVEKAA